MIQITKFSNNLAFKLTKNLSFLGACHLEELRSDLSYVIQELYDQRNLKLIGEIKDASFGEAIEIILEDYTGSAAIAERLDQSDKMVSLHNMIMHDATGVIPVPNESIRIVIEEVRDNPHFNDFMANSANCVTDVINDLKLEYSFE